MIDPEVCIDCALCIPECPVEAIFEEKNLPEDMKDYIEINARLATQWPVLTEQKDPLPDSDDWADVPDKRQWLVETA